MRRVLEFFFVALVSVIIATNFLPSTPSVIDGGRPWSHGFNNNFGCATEDITRMYEGYVNQWKQDVKYSFNKAEQEVYKSKPSPDIKGPHEDPKKCICKGTGVIKQGDGHTTVCPYHGKTFNKPLLILEK